MELFHKYELSEKIKKRKKECPYMRIDKIDGDCYYLADRNNTTYVLHIDFDGLNPTPSVGDGFYMSENMVEGIKENLYTFTFSTHIGEVYARQPHDFLKNPKEFLIYEYKDGKTILLEQWYG